jgi:hypothetical protein
VETSAIGTSVNRQGDEEEDRDRAYDYDYDYDSPIRFTAPIVTFRVAFGQSHEQANNFLKMLFTRTNLGRG